MRGVQRVIKGVSSSRKYERSESFQGKKHDVDKSKEVIACNSKKRKEISRRRIRLGWEKRNFFKGGKNISAGKSGR